MRTIIVDVHINGVKDVFLFADTIKGNATLMKMLKSLAKQQGGISTSGGGLAVYIRKE